jgi:hypothetical protein
MREPFSLKFSDLRFFRRVLKNPDQRVAALAVLFRRLKTPVEHRAASASDRFLTSFS